MSSIGMKCETGKCIYDNSTIWEETKEEKGFWNELTDRQGIAMVAFMWLMLLIVLILALILIRKDKKRSLKRAEDWANDPETHFRKPTSLSDF